MLPYLFITFLLGALIAWLLTKLSIRNGFVPRSLSDAQLAQINQLNVEIAVAKNIIERLEAEKQQTFQLQKDELASVQKHLPLQFENIGRKIIEERATQLSQLNQDSLNTILKPLADNIESFKKKVEEAYNTEAKERFSLGKELEKLMQLNQKVSEEANNLANALKGNSKVQGDWGQMILENILEKSGLVKDREYFIQETLKDDDGKNWQNEDGSRMQPDVIIGYPDNRKVIIDSKVSLTAYTRYVAAENSEEQKKAVDEHLRSIRKHIDDLSRKSYQDFAPTLDFVMMFIPNEPAYLVALQHDPELWHYAYHKRILLISPTNLIAALKLLADLWKREYQNKNALEIARQGSKLYDKLVGFVDTLTDIGAHLTKAQKSYDQAMGQLKDGNGNLISRAEKLRELGIKPKKGLPASLLNEAPETEENADTNNLSN